MIDLAEKTLRQNAALAGTYGERNKPQKHGSWNRKQRGVLNWRKIVHFQILSGLFQERLDASLQFFSMKSRVVFRIRIPWSW